MKNALNLLTLSLSFLLLTGCEKEDPFQYPENPGETEPELIIHTVRELASSEVWKGSLYDQGCGGSLPLVSTGGDNIVLALLPDTVSCTQEAAVRTDFSAEEITDVELSELDFEFTYVKMNLNDQSEIWISWYYKGMEFDLDIAPYLRLQAEPVSGVFKIDNTENGVVLELNGEEINPDFDKAGTENHFVTNGDPTGEQYFQAKLVSSNTKVETRLQFKYLRVTSFTIPES